MSGYRADRKVPTQRTPELVRRVLELRAAGLSQNQVARELGVSSSMVARIEQREDADA
jgi:transcriptional regulator with XRE-family HTH domain